MILVGIDEVGRGPIAGPVAACALAVLDSSVMPLFEGIKDSKKLSEKQREKWLEVITTQCDAGAIRYSVSFQTEETIDRINIRQATLKAVREAIMRLRLVPAEVKVLLDGGLVAPPEYVMQRTIIGGDAKEAIIAMASIVAKVTRDRRMSELGTLHPEYGFEKHKGYGTAFHYEAIRRCGLLPCHRRSFLKDFTEKA